MTMRHDKPLHRRQRGVSLIEALVAMAVMAFGMLALVGVQATLRLNADIAKQRSEATRMAQEDVENLRNIVSVEAAPGDVLGWDEIAASAVANVVVPAANATFRLDRTVDAPAGSAQKVVSVSVSWTDRVGQPEQVVLRSVVAGAAPVLSGLLTVPATATAPGQRNGRHPTIPVQAQDLGDGRSVFKPPQSGTVAWTFDNVTGVIRSVCTVAVDATSQTLRAADLNNCTPTNAQLLSGVVRFITAGPNPLTAADAENPPGPARNLDVQLTLTSAGHADPQRQCFDDAPTTIAARDASPVGFVNYFCIVYPNAAHTWSGISSITPLAFGDDDDDHSDWTVGAGGTNKVCRYTPAAADNATTANKDHPRNYVAVSGNLVNQNFLVIASNRSCPTDVAADPASGNLVNSNTLQHQPAP